MKTRPGFENIRLEKFNDAVWRDVEECRKIVGYQDGPDWDCPFVLQGEKYRDQFELDNPCIMNAFTSCYPCLAKEAHKWYSLGGPIPLSEASVFSEGQCLSVES